MLNIYINSFVVYYVLNMCLTLDLKRLIIFWDKYHPVIYSAHHHRLLYLGRHLLIPAAMIPNVIINYNTFLNKAEKLFSVCTMVGKSLLCRIMCYYDLISESVCSSAKWASHVSTSRVIFSEKSEKNWSYKGGVCRILLRHPITCPNYNASPA